ncbi:MAG: leucine--tRNA ligase [Candidatus Woesearchaeota archaeon]
MDFKEIEKKWQRKWEDAGIFKAIERRRKKKFYCLEMFPYPSAAYLHMGHVRNYTIGDVIARFKRMQGFNVLYPMGYDSFGLPAENAAKKEGKHPKLYTESAIEKIMSYQKALGNSYDWERVIATHRPEYYRWNQYFFLKMYEKGLAYRKAAPVNFCPNCNTVLADEEVISGKCWRCESDTETIELEQWFLKTRAYAEKLLEGIDRLNWPERLKEMQRNWIGKSSGIFIDFIVDGKPWPVFTTRPDTIYGVTFLVISAQHPRLAELVRGSPEEEATLKFAEACRKAKAREEIERLGKEGIFIGKYAKHPLTGEELPIWAGNFVLPEYGSGMVMAVPAHDQRDFEFARKYNLPIKVVIVPESGKKTTLTRAYEGDGVLVNSGEFSGLGNRFAMEKIMTYLEKKGYGKRAIQYKIRDWLISRQRYWGTPIPIVYCQRCGTVPVPEKELPVLLPEDVSFTEKGNPLLTSKSFVKTTCPKCKEAARRETDTMGGFFDSSWYFLRFCSPKEKKRPFNAAAVRYWMPVDQYIGGIEHAVGHLIYARFFTKVLNELGFIDFDEPFISLFNQGVVYKDGKKMSKSYGNTVTQEEVSKKYGIDTARLFLLFVAAPEKPIEWTEEGIEGMHRFVKRVIGLVEKANSSLSPSPEIEHHTNKTIVEVTEDIDKFRFNLAIIKLMSLVERLEKEPYQKGIEVLLKLLSPFAPHICEELWERLGKSDFLSVAEWPKPKLKKIKQEIELAEALVENVSNDGKKVIELSGIPKPKKVTLVVAKEWKFDFMSALKVELTKTREPGEIIKALLLKESLKAHSGEISKRVPKLVAEPSRMPQNILDQKKEISILKKAQGALEDKFNCAVEIVAEQDSKHPKASQAMPGKPAIIVE